jgi:oligoendopeptidase F
MFDTLPTTATKFANWSWEEIAPYYEDLAQRPLTAATVDQWLRDWSHLGKLMAEAMSRLSIANTIDTRDEAVEQQYRDYLNNVFLAAQPSEQILKQKLLASGLVPDGMAVPLHKMLAEAELFREENLPLVAQERELTLVYNKTIGAQTIEWEGEERTLTQLTPFFHTPDRDVRETIWQRRSERQLADRDTLNKVWTKLLDNRLQQATNAGFGDVAGNVDYRAYRWQFLKRFDYTPADCETFHQAIEEVIVPAATRIYQQLAADLGVDRLRPWDLDADTYPLQFPALKPFDDVAELEERSAAVFHRVDPVLGDYFETMRRENLLHLPNSKGKSPGAYCTAYPHVKRPFIFMNAVGTGSDVKTLLHEAGHAFHVFEASRLPYAHQMRTGSEFAEVASMAMELLASPYLKAEDGGFYTETADYARHRLAHLQKIVTFWPYMAVVDAFQHWVYTHPQAARDAANCDAAWFDLWDRFIPAIDWSGLQAAKETGWQRKLHIFRYPFYYVEYGLAQLGAVQVWHNARHDQAGAVAQYRSALALGGTEPLPQLYEAAGARFAFDTNTVNQAVTLIEQVMAELASVGES